MNLDWMAWTKPTATFFIIIFCILICMTVWEISRPGGAPRIGVLRFETTRGDRLFVSLLGSAYIHIIWMAIFPEMALWWALGISVGFALCVFRWV